MPADPVNPAITANTTNPMNTAAMQQPINARMPKELAIQETNMASQWKLWRQTFEFYATAIGLSAKPANVQAATFMSAIGPDATMIFNTFNLSEEDKNNINVIKHKFDQYFSPKINQTYTRYLFFNKIQGKDELFESYLTNLRTKVADCEFVNLEDSLMRDQIVRGIYSDKVRELLLAERDLTLSKAIDICRASEQANLQLKDMNLTSDLKEKDVLLCQSSKPKFKSGGNCSQNRFSKGNAKPCWRCGLTHEYRNCPAYYVKCRKCLKQGHYERQCKIKAKYKAKVKSLNDLEVPDYVDSNHSYSSIELHEIKRSRNACYVTVDFGNQVSANFKIDTGAEGNVITYDIVKKLGVPVKKSPIKRLKSFNNTFTPVLGEVDLKCIVQGKTEELNFLVVKGDFTCILGCKSCENLELIKINCDLIQVKSNIPEEVFQGIGCVKNFVYDMDLKEGATFKIHPPRKIPHALREKVKEEIDAMVKMKILVPVTSPTPAVSPLVIVKKGDKVRLCLDPTDINKAIKRRHFPLKTVEDIASRVKSAKYFTLLDAKKGFWQIPVSKRTSEYLTVNTPWGRYSFLRLPFGLASAPEIFQQIMQSILVNFKNAECSMDDILLWANSKEELRELTIKVIKKLLDCGIRLNKEKCEFEKERIKFLGHIFTASGVEIDPAKLQAINNLKTPACLAELQRFLGMVNYISKFVPNYSCISEPLRRLLHKDVVFEWSAEQQTAFAKLKEVLISTPKLAYYDVNKPVLISVDASSYAVGAVLLQEGRPIAYASRALSEAQQRYPQIEKEAFAIRFGCQKFHEYVFGKDLVVETDHKPLEAIAKKPLHLAPPRLQRILFDVMTYSPKIVYKRGNEIPIPDALSRDCILEALSPEENFDFFEVILDLPVPLTSFKELVEETNKDEELKVLKAIIMNGWPDTIKDVPTEVRKYWNYREELSVYEDLLFKAERLMVPKSMKGTYLKFVHQGHLGITLTLQRARSTVFWHGMSSEVETYIKQCAVCQKTARAPNTEELLMKPVPNFPWQRVATDLFEMEGKVYCLIADSYSGFFDFKKLDHPSSYSVIEYLKDTFATHGIPDILESDNGPQYNSRLFREFARQWKIHHITSSPHYPKSNGLSERYVQEAKSVLRRTNLDKSDYRLALLNYRNTPRSDIPSPAERLFGRPTRHLIPLHPMQRLPRESYSEVLRKRREEYARFKTTGYKSPAMKVGDKVRLKQSHRNWIQGEIADKLKAPRSYLVKTPDGNILRRNAEAVQPTKAVILPEREFAVRPSFSPPSSPSHPLEMSNPSRVPQQPARGPMPVTAPAPEQPRPPSPSVSPTMRTRSGRAVRPPDRLTYYH